MSRLPSIRPKARFGLLLLGLTILLPVSQFGTGGASAAKSGVGFPTVALPTLPVPTLPVPTLPVPTLPVPTLVPPTVVVTVPPIGATVQPTVSANPTSFSVGAGTTISLCGPVTAFASPTSVSSGSITIAGQTLQIAPGAGFTGAGITVGSNLCINFSLNAGGQISNGKVSAQASATLHICGQVTAFTSPTSVSSGSVTIGGQTLQLAPGATLSGANFTVGSYYCLDATTNPQAQISQGSVTASAPTSLNLCGVVDAYTAPTNVSAGSITVAGQTVVLAPGTTLSGGAVKVGDTLCGQFTTDPQGQITNGSITASVPTTLTLCGLVSAYLAPTSVSAGSITIGGQTLVLAPGTVLQGGSAVVGATLCGSLATNPQGQVSGGSITVQAPTSVTVCGLVTAFLPPTAVNPGYVIINGATTVLPAGWVPSAAILVGQSACVQPGTGGSPGPSGTPSATATPRAAPSATPGSKQAGTPVATPVGQGGHGGNGGQVGSAHGNLVQYTLPAGAGPWHMEWDSHHMLWLTEFGRGRLAEVNPTTLTLREFPLSGPRSRPLPLAIDRNNHIWIGENAGNRIDELSPSGNIARLTEWVLPHKNSRPAGIAVSGNGTVWFTEASGRFAHLNPKTGRLDEYTAAVRTHPYDLRLAKSGPIFVTANGNTATWVKVAGNHSVRCTTVALPTRHGRPAQLTITSRGVLVTAYRGNSVTWLDGLKGRVRDLPAATHLLKPVSRTVRAVKSGLPAQRFTVKPVVSRVRTHRTAHWAYWTLPLARSQPYGIRQIRQGNRVWLTEDRGNRVALLLVSRGRILEYALPRPHSTPKGLQLRRVGGSMQIWIAAYGVDRLDVLTP